MSTPRADRRAMSVVVTVVGLFCAAGLYRAVAALFLYVPLDPNEGWNAYLAAAAVSGRPLYPGPQQFLVNNYPPLSFYLVGGLGRALKDDIFAGRMVALLSFFTVAGLIAAVARKMGASALPAIFGAAFFSSVLLLESDYVGMDDPQLLGHALQLVALSILLRESRSLGVLVAAALLLVIALFVKHILFILPVAVFAWLLLVDRRRALTLGAFFLAFGILGLLWFRSAFGTGLLGHLVSPRGWSLSNLESGLSHSWGWLLLPLAGLGWLLVKEPESRYAKFCVIYSALALAMGLVSLGGDGVDVNALFDAAIALSLTAALVLDVVSRRWALSSVAALALVSPLAIILFICIDSDWYTNAFWTRPWSDENRTSEADVAFLKSVRGPALCETLALCYWAGKPDAFDVFNLSEAYTAGTLSPRPLLAAIGQDRFAVVEFESPKSALSLGRSFLDAFESHYVQSRVSDDGYFFVPRRAATPRAP